MCSHNEEDLPPGLVVERFDEELIESIAEVGYRWSLKGLPHFIAARMILGLSNYVRDTCGTREPLVNEALLALLHRKFKTAVEQGDKKVCV